MTSEYPSPDSGAAPDPISESATTDPTATDSPATDSPATDSTATDSIPPSTPASPPPSYVKLAMRNMVRKRGTSLFHFALTTLGLLAVLIGLSYLTR